MRPARQQAIKDLEEKMKKTLLFTTFMMSSVSAFAAPPLTDQINAVYAVEEQRKQAEEAAEANYQAQQRALELQAAQQAAQQAANQQLKIKRAEEQKRAANAQKTAAALAEKKRDQAYEDQLRTLEIQKKTIELQAMQAQVNRATDYIDQDLKNRAAQTDVIQSQADATRNLSEGTKSLLIDTGKAKVEDASGIFK